MRDPYAEITHSNAQMGSDRRVIAAIYAVRYIH